MRLLRGLAALSLLACAVTFAQTPAAPLPMPRLQFLDSSGRPLAGGKVYTYTAGTNTPLATYTDAGAAFLNANPVILDAGGFASIWVKSAVYKIVVQNSAGVQQWSADNVSNAGQIASSIGYAGADGTTRTLQTKLSITRDVMADFGAAGDGAADDRAAIQAALTWASAACGTIIFPAGHTFRVGSNPGGSGLLQYGPCTSMDGGGTIKVGNSIGNFDTLFKASGATIGPARIANVTIDMNGANNVISSAPTTGNRQTTFYFLAGGNYDTGGSGLALENVRFLNGHGVWTLYSNSPNVSVRGCLWDNWGVGATVGYDASNLYLDGDGATVANNVFNAAASSQAHTAIEVHRSNKTVVGNIIKGFPYGIIYSADQNNVTTTAGKNVVIANNTIDRTADGIEFWTDTGAIDGMTIQGNTILIDRNIFPLYGTTGNEAGIYWYAQSDFPISNVTIAGNTIEWNADTGSYTTNRLTSGMDFAAGTGAAVKNLTISGNLLANAPADGIYFAPTDAVSGLTITGNTFRNNGQKTGNPAAFRAGIFSAFVTHWNGSSITNNTFVDDQATPTMQLAYYWGGVAGDAAGSQVLLARNTVRYATAPANYFTFDVSSPQFDVDVPGYAGNAGLVALTNGTTGNYAPKGAAINDSATGRTWRNLTSTAAPPYFSSQELRDTVPTSGAYLQGDIVWAADAAIGGFAGWVNVLSGSPGTFSKIQLANAGTNSPFTSTVSGPSFTAAGSLGLTTTATAGSCTLTITGGLITAKSGC